MKLIPWYTQAVFNIFTPWVLQIINTQAFTEADTIKNKQFCSLTKSYLAMYFYNNTFVV